MEAQEKLEIIQEALKDYRNGTLAPLSTLMIIELFAFDQKPLTESQVAWVQKIFKELGEPEGV